MYAPIAMNATWPKLSSPVKPNCELQPEREDRVDAGDDADERPEVAARERAHTTLARPKSPCGRTISAAASTTNATTGL